MKLQDDEQPVFALLERHDRIHMDDDFRLVPVPKGQSLDFDPDRATRRWLWPYLGRDYHLVGFIVPTTAQPTSEE